MNIQELISAIRRRPGMFVQDRRLDYVKYFITGFHCHGSVTKTAVTIDEYFYQEFHIWVREWIENKIGMEFDEERGWYEYIISSTKNNEEAFDLFFKLADEFFKEFHQANKY